MTKSAKLDTNVLGFVSGTTKNHFRPTKITAVHFKNSKLGRYRMYFTNSQIIKKCTKL
jgi:hypothetical protein